MRISFAFRSSYTLNFPSPCGVAATLLLRPAPAAVQALAFSTLEEMERGMIGQAIARYAGNLTEVARQLGITRQTLYNKIKRYGL